ncbi:MAG: rRNA maturation endonuclease Nob1 [Roseivirga sp.]|jgi:rRNA maturation endonuclease Nob1
MAVFLAAAVLLGLGFAGIAIKIWAKKDGEFNGTCASNSPFLNEEGESCSFCGASPEDKCKKEDSDNSKVSPANI